MAMHYVYILESLTVPVRSLVPGELQPGTARYLQPATGFVRPKERKRRAVVRPWPDEGGQYGYALRLHSRIAHRSCSLARASRATARHGPLLAASRWIYRTQRAKASRRSPALAGRRRTVWLCTTFTFSNRSPFLFARSCLASYSAARPATCSQPLDLSGPKSESVAP